MRRNKNPLRDKNKKRNVIKYIEKKTGHTQNAAFAEQ